MSIRLIQVTNVSTSVTKDQFRTFFSHLGRIEDLQLYPESETLVATVAAKVGYVRFERSEIAQAALNLTSTIFLDRPVICSLVKPGGSSSSSSSSSLLKIPDEIEAIKLCPPVNSNIILIPGGPTWPNNVLHRIINIPASVTGTPATSVIETVDPNLSDRSLPPYPLLAGHVDQTKVEEIRRTVYVSNLDPRVTFENLNDLFSQIGEVKYIRLTKSQHQLEYEQLGLTSHLKQVNGVELPFTEDSVGAYVEFSEQPSIIKALCLNGLNFGSRIIRVNHATNAIIIPANVKEQVSIEDIRREAQKYKSSSSSSKKHGSSHRSSSQRHGSDHHRHHHRSGHKSSSSKHDKRSGSAESDSSGSASEASEEEESESSKSDSSSASPPPRKQRRASRSRSDSKSKQIKKRSPSPPPVKSKSSKGRSRSRERDRDRDRDRKDRDRESTKEKDKDKDKDKDKEKYRDRDRDRDRDREKDRDRDRERDRDKNRSATSGSSSKKRDEEKVSSSSKKDAEKSSSKTSSSKHSSEKSSSHSSRHDKAVSSSSRRSKSREKEKTKEKGNFLFVVSYLHSCHF